MMMVGFARAVRGSVLSPNINPTMSCITARPRLANETTYWSDRKRYRIETTTEKSSYVEELFHEHDTARALMSGNTISIFVPVCLVYWGVLTFRNIVHFVTACAVDQWWFPGDTSRHYAIGTSFKRAFTTNFGTIALGSLLVSIVKALRFLKYCNRNCELLCLLHS
jgi:hypothetical protein